jgi:hypothetical protein
MKRLSFVANRQARSLAGGKSNLVGVMVPDLGTGYIGEIIRGIDAELAESNYDLMLFTTHRAAVKEANYVANLAQDTVDGLLLVLPRNPVDYIGTLEERNFPYVLIDHQGMVRIVRRLVLPTGRERITPRITQSNWAISPSGLSLAGWILGQQWIVLKGTKMRFVTTIFPSDLN